MHVCEKKAFLRASVTETRISFEYGERKHWGNGKRIVHNAHTHTYIFFSPLQSQVWRKACTAKDCKDDAVGKISMQWESIEQTYEGLEQKNS